MISIVVPTYNRSYNLSNVYREVDQALTKAGITYELIFVDDVGDKNTPKVLKELCTDHTSVRGVLLKKNVGQQNATLAGIRQAKYGIVVTMDDDLSSHPKWIPLMLEELQKGYPVCYGVSKKMNVKVHRSLMTYFKEVAFNRLLGKPKDKRLTSFRMIDSDLKAFIMKDQSPKVYLSARTLQYTKKIQNIEIDYIYHEMVSGYSNRTLFALMVNIIKYYGYYKVKKNIIDNTSVQYEIKEILS